jgi:hypothetical protein
LSTTSTTPINAAVAEKIAKMRADRDAIWNKLPAFDLKKARAGHPYVHLYDLPQRRVAYCDIRPISAPHEGWMVWAGEWLIFSYAELGEFLRMVDNSVLGLVEVER